MSIAITIDDSEFQRRVRGLLEALGDDHLSKVLGDIGEHLVERTKQNIEAGHDWQDRPFAENTAVTLARKRGVQPLIDSTTFVTTRIFHHVSGRTLELRAHGDQAAVLHYGAAKGQFGRGKTRNFPIPWGPIAPRPYFPFTDNGTALVPAAQEEAVRLVREYVEASHA